jgi:hypothetical protein
MSRIPFAPILVAIRSVRHEDPQLDTLRSV